ncbi:hypothetical protein FZEAL_4876 [Fusarium zealandicum]|uniref:Heterokaryon incompatibility domain-containing protein n=1 Tax=Fusarium zealandicum TaxID=1053134 RepID=A0A8H4UKV3_9HYPO|nr:hypothetical protein FZEAL_4876 [Fusarium zealandicum]
MLCQECKFVFEEPLVLVQKPRQLDRWSANCSYGITLSQLELKATFCYICRGIIRQLVASRTSTRLQIQADTVLQIKYALSIQTDPRGCVRLWNQAFLDGQGLGPQVVHFDKVSIEEPPLTSTNTNSAETLEFVKRCLNACRDQHKACVALTPSWSPTRLVQVEQNSLRLVESTVSEPYASLSHCWGNAQILKLTVENMASLKREIPIARLPQTFRDAIQVVKSLGIKYIWIDSLCIIQNSNDDWQREARTMLKVYQHAQCNIAASHSANSFGGLFRNRNPGLLGSVLDIDNGKLKGRFHLVDQGYFGQEVDDAPLNRRSWVAQERLLSPRIIHFAPEQVIWDCAELTACESLPHDPKVWCKYGAPGRKFGCKQNSEFTTTPKTVQGSLGRWARIVNTYSACGLTVLGDKLMAIFGVAENLRNELGLEYCAGLWQHKMEIQLAWFVLEHQTNRSPRNDLAPSWSWLSINGAVDMQQIDLYLGYDIKPLVSITEVDLRRETGDARCEKIVGFLRMRCSLNPVTVKEARETSKSQAKAWSMQREHALFERQVGYRV